MGPVKQAMACLMDPMACLTGPVTRSRLRVGALCYLTSGYETTSAMSTFQNAWNRLRPVFYHISILSGHKWVQELLDSHRDRMQDSH